MPPFVGTSGWSYKEWRPAVYPPHVAPADFLNHYATIFTSCEINATHYRLPAKDTVARWAAAVPDDFRFAAKVHQRLTDRSPLAWTATDAAFFERFLESLAPLGDRLGPVLIQPADGQERDDDALESMLRAIPAGRHPVFELRHESWHDAEVTERIAASGGTICVTESEGAPPDRLPPGPLLYVRLRADRYDDAARTAWRARLSAEATVRTVYAIARHEGLPPDDPHAGVGLARWLMGTGGANQ